MAKRIIIGVHISHRVENVPHVQQVFTEFGCYIRTRIGLHEVADGLCSPGGVVLLDMFGDEAGIARMESTLKAMEGVEVRRMEFEIELA